MLHGVPRPAAAGVDEHHGEQRSAGAAQSELLRGREEAAHGAPPDGIVLAEVEVEMVVERVGQVRSGIAPPGV